VSLVVVQDGHAVPAQVQFFPRLDVEDYLRTSGAQAGFELLIPAHYLDDGKPMRIFAVSERDRAVVRELPLAERQVVH
jgi:hypothetical protein